MTDSERTARKVLLDLELQLARKRYRRAGRPFGRGQGLSVWIVFDTCTTVN
jgi:hypothetical protein